MATTSQKIVQVAVESTYANPDAEGVPSTVGLTFGSLPGLQFSEVNTPGEYDLVERNDSRDGPYAFPPELDTAYSNGSQLTNRRGTVTLRCHVEGIGTGAVIADWDDHPLHMLLASGLAKATDTTSATDTVAAGVDADTFTATSANGYRIGTMFSTLIAGKYNVSATTDINGTTIYHSPEMDAALADEDIRSTRTLYAARGAAMGTVEESVCIKIATSTTLTYCYGCRWQRVTMSIEGRTLQVEIELYSPYIVDDHGNAAAVSPSACPGGDRAKITDCPIYSTEDAPDCVAAVAGLASARLDIDRTTLNITLTNTLAIDAQRNACGLGLSDLEITDTQAEATFTLRNKVDALTTAALAEQHRSFMFIFGPFTEGNGVAVYFPAAVFAMPPMVDIGGERVTMPVTIRAGRFAGDDATADAAGSSIRIGLGQ